MTGEMHSININGMDSNGDSWPLHAAIAKALGGKLSPFDIYQGPYICIGPDIRAGASPYAVPIKMSGTARLWICGDEETQGELVYVYRDDTEQKSELFFLEDFDSGIEYSKQLLE